MAYDLKIRLLPLQFIYEQLTSSSVTNLPPETRDEYQLNLLSAENLYKEIHEKVKKITNAILLWQSFFTRCDYLLSWVDKIRDVSVTSLVATKEFDQESLVVKFMRFNELDKRAFEKQRIKDRIDHEAGLLIKMTSNKRIVAKQEFLNEKWVSLRDEIRTERIRLDTACKIWREFQTSFQVLDELMKECAVFTQEEAHNFNSERSIQEELKVLQVF